MSGSNTSDWVNYPQNLPAFDGFLYDAFELQRQLAALESNLFGRETELTILDAHAAQDYKAQIKTFNQSDGVMQYAESCSSELRIIFLWRPHSMAPVSVSKELLLKLLHHHTVGASFLDLVLGVQATSPLPGIGNSFWSAVKEGRSAYELCYQLRYIDENHHKQGQRWSERQIGISHKFGTNVKSTMVLLGSQPGKAQERIQQLLSGGRWLPQTCTSPLALHVVAISSCLNSWTSYLQEKGDECDKETNRAVTIRLGHPSVTFSRLQKARDLELKLTDSHAILQSSLHVITTLQSCGRALLEDSRRSTHQAQPPAEIDGSDWPEDPQMKALGILHLKTQGHLDGLEVLQRRVDIIVGLLSDGLSERGQRTANSIADSSRELTMKSLNDSYIVKIVTVITLTYLPMQGVATFFGMNLSVLPTDTNRLRFADNWWLFMATAVPLTVLTLMGLGLAMVLENRKKERKKNNQLQNQLVHAGQMAMTSD